MPRYAPLYLLLLGSCRCGPPSHETATLDTAGTGPVPCGVVVERTFPEDGATVDAPATIDVYLSDTDTTFAFVTDLPGAFERDDASTEWRFVLDAPLTPETTYTVGFSTCSGDGEITFTTSEVGEPLAAPPAGRVYALDILNAHVIEPHAIGSILTSALVDPALVSLTTADPDALAITTGVPVTETQSQDTCDVTGSGLADFEGTPRFDAPIDAFDLLFAGGKRARLYQAQLTGTLAPDASRIGGATLSGEFYAGRLAEVFGFADGDEACDYARSFGGTCVTCTEDPGSRCFLLEVDRIPAPLVEGATLVPVAADDCSGCETGAPVCPE